MVRFDVLQPENLSEAISLLSEHKQKANLIAGGQNLLVLLRHRLIKPRYLVNIKSCSEMEYLKEDGDVIKILPARDGADGFFICKIKRMR